VTHSQAQLSGLCVCNDAQLIKVNDMKKKYILIEELGLKKKKEKKKKKKKKQHLMQN
jgi:hypothetical protein